MIAIQGPTNDKHVLLHHQVSMMLACKMKSLVVEVPGLEVQGLSEFAKKYRTTWFDNADAHTIPAVRTPLKNATSSSCADDP